MHALHIPLLFLYIMYVIIHTIALQVNHQGRSGAVSHSSLHQEAMEQDQLDCYLAQQMEGAGRGAGVVVCVGSA